MSEDRLLWELSRRPTDAAIFPYLVEWFGEGFARHLLKRYPKQSR